MCVGVCMRQVETKFVRLRRAVDLGDDIDGWRVCWLGGWDKGRVFYVAMVLRVSQDTIARALIGNLPKDLHLLSKGL